MNYFLGIDLGTSYFKAGIFDEQGNLKGLGRQFLPKVSDGVTCELVVDVFWKTIRNCLNEALQMADIPATAIRSLSYSTQTNSFILLDAHHQPLTPLILWLDNRAVGMELSVGDPDEFMRHTGLGLVPDAQFTVAKLKWFRQRRPDIRKKTAYILSISDFFTFSLTGQKMCDFSTASMSGLFDITTGAWRHEQLENFDIQADMLPVPHRMGTLVGTTTANATELTGLPAGIACCLGGLDHHCAAIGVGIPSNEAINESTGTVLSCVAYTNRYLPQKNICVAPGLHDGHFFRMVFDENGAGSLEWYQQNHAPDYTIPELLEMAATIESGCEGLTAFPCAGTYPGLTGFTKTKAFPYQHGHYVRALLESTAYSLFRLVKTLKNDSPIPAIISSGGGSRSKLWVKIKSDIINHARSFPLGEDRGGTLAKALIPACTESACMGAAMLGALGTNAFPDYHSLVKTWARFKRI